MTHFYPTLVTDHFVKTINFYEDCFGFAAVVEQDGYALLQSSDNADNCIAVFDSKHECLKKSPKSVQGVILNMASTKITTIYDHLYIYGRDRDIQRTRP